MAAGAFAPAAAFLYGISTLPIGVGLLSAIVLACGALGIALHLLGSAILGRLARMISIEFLVIAAPIFMVVAAVLTVVLWVWLGERAERRKPR